MRIRSVKDYPYIKHGQRVNHRLARRFFNQVRIWMGKANQTIADLKNLSPDGIGFLKKVETVKDGIESVGKRLVWLGKQGFTDKKIEMDFNLLEKRFMELMDKIDQ
jgi:hypothetical protein